MIVVLGGPSAEAYCVAKDLEQAQGCVLQAIAWIIEASPLLRDTAAPHPGAALPVLLPESVLPVTVTVPLLLKMPPPPLGLLPFSMVRPDRLTMVPELTSKTLLALLPLTARRFAPGPAMVRFFPMRISRLGPKLMSGTRSLRLLEIISRRGHTATKFSQRASPPSKGTEGGAMRRPHH